MKMDSVWKSCEKTFVVRASCHFSNKLLTASGMRKIYSLFYNFHPTETVSVHFTSLKTFLGNSLFDYFKLKRESINDFQDFDTFNIPKFNLRVKWRFYPGMDFLKSVNNY